MTKVKVHDPARNAAKGTDQQAGPVKHNRLPPLREIPLDQILVEEFEHDPLFLKYFMNWTTGKREAGLTRVHDSSIISGFLRRKDGRFEISSELKPEYVDSFVRSIRGGERPSLYLYPAIDQSGRYVCPDDEICLAAYRQLGIQRIPSIILNPKKYFSGESVLFFKNIPKSAPQYIGYKTIPREYLAGFEIDDEKFSEAIVLLKKKCREDQAKIKSFHVGTLANIHYHQRIYQTLRIHVDILDSISYLVSKNRMQQAMALSRVAYEGFLNFNVDWLAPMFIGPRQQLLSRIKDMSAFEKARGQKSDASSTKLLGGLEHLLDSVAQKAEISLLGGGFYKKIYHSMSSVTHQSYGELEDVAVDFRDKDSLLSADQKAVLAGWLNVITGSLTLLALDEVGAAAPMDS